MKARIKENPVMTIIESLQNLQVEYIEQKDVNINENPKIEISGLSPTTNTAIFISLSFSIAPSLQSLLSRGGVSTVSALVKAEGVVIYYESNLSVKEMELIGSFLYNMETTIKESAKEKIANKIFQEINEYNEQ